MLDWVRARPRFTKFILLSGKAITYLVYAFYPLYLAFLILSSNGAWLRCLLVPAVSFLAVTVFRAALNAPRPYEKYGITPLYNKSTKGKSFPSRHTFSVFVIGVAAFYVYPPIGIAISVLGVWLAIGRLLCGVHFIKDIVSGIFCGIVAGLVGFYLI